MEYYSRSLHSQRLKMCYDCAPGRIRQFLEAEILHVLNQVPAGSSVLDLGCGYGRVAVRLAERAGKVTGIDISEDNIRMAREFCPAGTSTEFLVMDASRLQFADEWFDLTVCVQNGISAFKKDPEILLKEAVRVTRKGGMVLFSSYSEKIWDSRLEWFRIQAELGLIGELDMERTGNGRIVCRDGFSAVTYSPDEFMEVTRRIGLEADVYEVDRSSVFCRIRKSLQH